MNLFMQAQISSHGHKMPYMNDKRITKYESQDQDTGKHLEIGLNRTISHS